MQTDNANIIFSQIPVNFLVDAISSHLMEKLLPLIPTPAPAQNKKSETLVTRKEVAARFNVSLPTVDKYTRQGTLKGYRIAGQIRYKESELLSALSQMQTCN